MSRRINIDPLAVTSAGTVLVNVAHFDGPRRGDAMVARVAHEPGRVFVGLELSRTEVRLLLEHIGHGQREVAARLVGLRRSRSQRDKT
ncbi:MAG: hypothetical protein KJ015_09750 [Myxococcales bacterium]|nr:hypothetical protein [Myxococcales bacterium]